MGILEEHFPGTIGVNALMIEELSTKEEVYALKELGHLRMVNHRNIEHTIIRHGIRSLTITEAVAYTYRHHLTPDDI